MRYSLGFALVIALAFGLPEAAVAQSSAASVTISARVVAAADDPLTRGAVNMVELTEGETSMLALSTGVGVYRPAGFLLRIAARSDDWSRGLELPAWDPAAAGAPPEAAHIPSRGEASEWFDVTVEHTES